MFINACYACTGQREFYSSGLGQRVSIDFLHRYILTNYRRLYARTLSAGINHFNQAQIVLNLLSSGKRLNPESKEEEGELILACLRSLPSQRAWKLLDSVKKNRINNRRTRAIAAEFLAGRRDIAFDAVKYRSKVRAVAHHAHAHLSGELGAFLYGDLAHKTFETPIFESFRRARHSAAAIYDLPLTVAEGFANAHGIPRETFLRNIAPRMTPGERLRLESSTRDMKKVKPDIDWQRLPLTRLAIYVASLSLDERRDRQKELTMALREAAAQTNVRAPMRLGKVASVLDISHSSGGSTEKRRRPFALALAAHFLLESASDHYRPFWTGGGPNWAPILRVPRGQTNLAHPLLQALAWGPELVVILSDGYENDPPQGAAEVLRLFRARIDPKRQVSIVHVNPVFQPDDFTLRQISPATPTVGLRDAKDLSTVLAFARFAEGDAPLSELESMLEARVKEFVRRG